ncbi:prepilin peptidase [Virgibacillus siamensis]|uniref:prepilin peptidase n=1 Tax=Virgibacillus siamensis TaxID=480071 RepID=UPI00098627B1|nr:A24 family peptidase [Virgibacillus siamensis]
MENALILFFFVLGIIFGSFFNVAGLRVPKREPFVNDRSHCPNCGQSLSWYDLIPVLSFIFLRGKCRDCGKRISFIYPVVELATGFFFSFSYIHIGLNVELIIALTLVSMLMILFVSDVHYMLIPNRILLFFLPVFIILRMINPLDPWWDSIAGGIIALVLLAVIIVVSKGGMGGGDMKLFGLLGIVLGTEKVLLSFFLATLIGALFGGLLLVFRIVGRKQEVPFGPYIIVGALLAYYYGDDIIYWYFNLV